jgi:chemotaxis protein MotC
VAVLPLVALCTLSAGAAPLEPYRMVRSLQLVQDGIAAGDHAALPMQRKLLEMIDQRFRSAGSAELEDPRNFHALLVYGMSGGNPATVEIVLSRLEPETSGAMVAQGVLRYLKGETNSALAALATVVPTAETADLGAFLALVKGTVLGGQDAQAGMVFLDQARLLGPGTLVEEAALRRTIDLSMAVRDAERFLDASDLYARRFLRSPYASQFAESFVAGVAALHGALDLEQVAGVISQMERDHQEAIYLRLARMGTIEGFTKLTGFAAAKAAAFAPESAGHANPRAALYSNIALVTSDTVGDVAERLNAIDRSRLSDDDRKLLDAALAIAMEMTAAPRPAGDVAREPLAPEAESEDTQAGVSGGPAAEATEPVRIIVDETMKRLETIDRLLEETGG